MSPSILFISHDASRTGAPIVILRLLQWLKEHSNLDLHILLVRGGELKSEFRKVGEVYEWNPEQGTRNFAKRLATKLTGRTITERHREQLLKKLSKRNFDLIYANSTASSEALAAVSQCLKCPSVLHVHELAVSISQFGGKENFISSIPFIQHFIAASEATKENLISSYSIPSSKVTTIYEPVDLSALNTLEKGSLHNILNIPSSIFIVGSSGTTDWRKGADLLPQLASLVCKQDREIVFVWIGGDPKDIQFEKILYDIKKLNLEKQVFFLGSRENPYPYFQDFDLFLLLSREDPFPLVCLENAALGKPVICFEGAGGMPEFIKKGGGLAVPYLDLITLTDQILALKNAPGKINKLGSTAQKLAAQYDISIFSHEVSTLLRSVFNIPIEIH